MRLVCHSRLSFGWLTDDVRLHRAGKLNGEFVDEVEDFCNFIVGENHRVCLGYWIPKNRQAHRFCLSKY